MNKTIKIIIATILGIILFTGVVGLMLFQPYRVSGYSMMPTLTKGDMVVLFRHQINFNYGDIVIYPGANKVKLMGRVFGLPGDNIAVRDDIIFVNGIEFKSELIGEYSQIVDVHDKGGIKQIKYTANKYLENMPGVVSYNTIKAGKKLFNMEYTVPNGRVFIIGDNHDTLVDSMYYGMAHQIMVRKVVLK